MNVLVLYHGLGNTGGGEKTLFSFLKYSDKFCRICIATLVPESIPDIFIRVKLLNFRFNYVHRRDLTLLDFSKIFFYSILYIYKLTFTIKHFNPDVIYVHDNYNKALVPIIKLLSGARIVCHCHDVIKNTITDNLLSIIYRNYFDRIIFPSNAALNSVFKGKSKISTVIKPMPIQQFERYRGPLISRDEFRLLTVGLLDYVKGHDIVINAMAYLRKFYPDITLTYTIVGNGFELTNLKDQVLRLGLSNCVRFLGYVEDLNDIFQQSHVSIIPSRQESFGLSFMESALRGVPIIYSDVDAMSENAGSYDISKFKCGDHVSCAESIIHMINNYDLQLQVADSFRIYCQSIQADSNEPSYNFLFNDQLCVD